MVNLRQVLKEQTEKPKAIIMAGGAGVGKTYISDKFKKEAEEKGWLILNPDQYSRNPDPEKRLSLAAASSIINQQIKDILENGETPNILWDTTASKPKKIQELKDKGYDILMIMVYAHPSVAFEQNFARADKEGEESLNFFTVLKTWESSYNDSHIEEYKEMFGDNFIIIDNTSKPGTNDEKIKSFNKAAKEGGTKLEEYIKNLIGSDPDFYKQTQMVSQKSDLNLSQEQQKDFDDKVKKLGLEKEFKENDEKRLKIEYQKYFEKYGEFLPLTGTPQKHGMKEKYNTIKKSREEKNRIYRDIASSVKDISQSFVTIDDAEKIAKNFINSAPKKLNELTQFLVNNILKEIDIKSILPKIINNKPTTALFGGGFKPPTAGHLSVIQKALQDHPEIDNIVIFVGGKERDGIIQEQSYRVWDEHYKNLIDKPVKVLKSTSPIGDIYKYSKQNPNNNFYWLLGAREDKKEDIKDIESRILSIKKYPNLTHKTISTLGKGMSGTNARRAIQNNDLETFKTFLPEGVDKNKIWNILTTQQQNKNKDFDRVEYYKTYYTNLSPSDFNVSREGNSIKIDNIVEPEVYVKDPKFDSIKTISIKLYEVLGEITLSKDNAVSTNGDPTGGSFTVDDQTYKYKIYPLENPYDEPGTFYNVYFHPEGDNSSVPLGGKENYIKILSTMYKIIVDFVEMFQPDYIGISSLDNTGDKNYHKIYASLTNNQSNRIPGYYRKDVALPFNSDRGTGKFVVMKRKEQLNENASYSNHIDYKQQIRDLTKYMLDKGMKLRPLPKVVFKHGDSENAKDFFGKTAYYSPDSMTICLYTEGRHPKDIVRSFSHEMIHHMQNLEGRIGNNSIKTTNTLEDDYLTKIEEEANLKGTMTFRNYTDSISKKPKKKNKDPFGLKQFVRELAQGLEEVVTGDSIKCDKCGWMWKIEEGGEDIFKCHQCGFRNPKLEINENTTSEPTIYLDMDGVIADFDQRFKDLSGMTTDEYKDKYGMEGFWDFIDEENKVEFWAGIPPMPDAEQLIDYIEDSQYDYEILTSPSLKPQSRSGKTKWIEETHADLFSKLPKINFKFSTEKQDIKSQLSKNDILIDDREDNITRWNKKGGTGIHHTSAINTIEKLNKLGL